MPARLAIGVRQQWVHWELLLSFPVASDPSSMNARIYKTMADALWQGLASGGATEQAPSIVIE